MQYIIAKGDDGKVNLTVLIPGNGLKPIAESHPYWDAIFEGVLADDDSVLELIDLEQKVAIQFERLSDRITVANGHVYIDGDEVHNALTDQIIRFMDEGVEDWKPLVNFFEKVLSNPNERSREQLYEWIVRHQLTINHEGDIVAYKGVNKDVSENTPIYTSIHSGPAIVDGEAYEGHVPNSPGSVIEIARSAVDDDPYSACSTGLHVGNYRYAKNFGSAVLEVHVNPRDVVSVPNDSNFEKVRTCRYTVIGEVENKYETALLPENEVEDDEFFCACGYDYGDCVEKCDEWCRCDGPGQYN